jgi:hypothetical protein
MMNLAIRFGAAALLMTALAGSGPAWAQDEEDEKGEAEDDSDPCAGVEGVPCAAGEESDEGGGETVAGGDEGESEAPAGDGAAMAAEGDVEVEAGAAMGPTLPAGKLAITAAVQVGLSSELGGGEAGTPLSIAPDVWYGINEKLSAGVVTSIHGLTGFWGGQVGNVGTGVCLSDEPGTDGVAAGCNGIFDNAGVEAMYSLKSSESLGFAAVGGLHALSFDPQLLDVKIGGRGMWRAGRIGVGFAPSVLVALTERGDEGGNKDQLLVPVDLSFMVVNGLYLGVQSGIAGTLQGFGESYTVPVAFGGLFMINPKIMVAAAVSFDRVTGGTPEGVEDTLGTADRRSASLILGYTM